MIGKILIFFIDTEKDLSYITFNVKNITKDY